MRRSEPKAFVAVLCLLAACDSDASPSQQPDAGAALRDDGGSDKGPTVSLDAGEDAAAARDDGGMHQEDADSPMSPDAGRDGGSDSTPEDAQVSDATAEEPIAPCSHPDFVAWVAPEPDSNWGSGQSDGRSALPDIVCGPPLEPKFHGAFNTASLGNGGTIILGFSRLIVDGPGVDFIVFENPFSPTFPELATVSVSPDGATWYEFPCTAAYPTPGGNYGTCAGWHMVLGKPGDPPSTWTNPETAGGDQYDLADLNLPAEIEGIRYVRITDREDQASQVFDLDAVSIVNGK